jgi:hypothetical protein
MIDVAQRPEVEQAVPLTALFTALLGRAALPSRTRLSPLWMLLVGAALGGFGLL